MENPQTAINTKSENRHILAQKPKNRSRKKAKTATPKSLMTPSSSIWDMSYSQMLSLPHPDVVGMGGEGGGPPAKIIHGNFFQKSSATSSSNKSKRNVKNNLNLYGKIERCVYFFFFYTALLACNE